MASLSIEIQDVKLTTSQRVALFEALSSAFTPDELERLVYLRLEQQKLYEITSKGADYLKILTEFIQWLERYGHVAEFIKVAYDANPRNPELHAIAKELGFAVDAPPKARLEHMLEQFAHEFGMATDLPQDRKFERMLETFARELNLRPTSEVDRQTDQARLTQRQYADVPHFLGWLSNAAQRVCRIEGEGKDGKFTGTGFLVGRDRVLTAYHVVEPMIKLDALARCRCRFGYETRDDGIESESKLIGMSAKQPLIHFSPYDQADFSPYDQADLSPANLSELPRTAKLNYALLRLADTVEIKRGWYSLANVAPARKNTMIYLVHHPNGAPLKLSHPPGILCRINEDETRYEYIDGKTSPGSSGAPCFDEYGNLIAMHYQKDRRVFRPDGLGIAVPLTAIRDSLLEYNVELT